MYSVMVRACACMCMYVIAPEVIVPKVSVPKVSVPSVTVPKVVVPRAIVPKVSVPKAVRINTRAKPNRLPHQSLAHFGRQAKYARFFGAS